MIDVRLARGKLIVVGFEPTAKVTCRDWLSTAHSTNARSVGGAAACAAPGATPPASSWVIAVPDSCCR